MNLGVSGASDPRIPPTLPPSQGGLCTATFHQYSPPKVDCALLPFTNIPLLRGVVGSQVVMDPTLICKKTRRLRGKLADICKKEPALLKEISKGVSQGSKECQYQFRSRRWNCTTVRRSLKKVLMRDTRETGFVNAITAAGVTYAVTRACTMGDLVECSCDKTVKAVSCQSAPKKPRDYCIYLNVDCEKSAVSCQSAPKKPRDYCIYLNVDCEKSALSCQSAPKKPRGYCIYLNVDCQKSAVSCQSATKKPWVYCNSPRRCLNQGEMKGDAVKSFMRTECKCHGLSGSCTLRTCWRKMPPFRDVGNRLKERFDGAAKVIPSNDGHSFIPEGPTIKPPGRGDLVYSEDSPDFCKANRKTGSLGTQGRQCNATSPGVEGCELLCCGRGFDTRQVREKFNCKCRFKWCCEWILEAELGPPRCWAYQTSATCEAGKLLTSSACRTA
uniref:Protein Wnt n=1 Tax=Timema monikensis TaxID=170555 RepID=A0A7R9DXI1_9NEOP|nr:unnamed protein product [Timema monikensis]